MNKNIPFIFWSVSIEYITVNRRPVTVNMLENVQDANRIFIEKKKKFYSCVVIQERRHKLCTSDIMRTENTRRGGGGGGVHLAKYRPSDSQPEQKRSRTISSCWNKREHWVRILNSSCEDCIYLQRKKKKKSWHIDIYILTHGQTVIP